MPPLQALGPTCEDCGRFARLQSGKRVYPGRPDIHERLYWVCVCGARCGTYKGTAVPLGTPGGITVRNARMRAHSKFDPLWKGEHMSRGAAYAWLADAMGMHPDECHIGQMDAPTARRAADLAEDLMLEIIFGD